MHDPVRGLLSKNLKRYRASLGFSQIDLASEADVSTSLIAAIETNKKFPSSVTLGKLAKALKVDVYQLFLRDEKADAGLRAYLELGELRESLQSEVKELLDKQFRDHLDELKES